MTKRRVHIGNLQIKMTRTASGDPARVAAEIGREVMNAAAHFSKGKTGRIELKEMPVGRVTMSDNVGKQIASTFAGKLDGVIHGGKK